MTSSSGRDLFRAALSIGVMKAAFRKADASGKQVVDERDSRFFILAGSRLEYWASEKDAQSSPPRGSYDLRDLDRVHVVVPGGPLNFPKVLIAHLVLKFSRAQRSRWFTAPWRGRTELVLEGSAEVVFSWEKAVRKAAGAAWREAHNPPAHWRTGLLFRSEGELERHEETAAVVEQLQQLVEGTFLKNKKTRDRRDGAAPAFLEVVAAMKVQNGTNWDDYTAARDAAQANRRQYGPTVLDPDVLTQEALPANSDVRAELMTGVG